MFRVDISKVSDDDDDGYYAVRVDKSKVNDDEDVDEYSQLLCGQSG